MKVTLFLDKTLEENASLYFEKSKRAKQKLEGAKEALAKAKADLGKKEKPKEQPKTRKVRKKWYEQYHWFHSSEGILCIGGRDANTNEQLLKKHTKDDEIVLHSEVPGSPFFVIKDTDPGEDTIEEAAIATASYSRAWRSGLGNVEVYAVKREQLSKEAPSGEYMGKGSFMVRGERKHMKAILELGVGLQEGRVVAGPVRAIASRCDSWKKVIPGREKTSDVAKSLRKALGGGNLDSYIRALPAGGCTMLGDEQRGKA